jgi:hypothetical protein
VFLGALADQCRALPGDELTSLDRVLERKLYDIDRTDIQAVTDGSDDGFLYARGFIVAMGRDFYDAVVGDPQVAVLDAECEVRDAAERNIRRITLTCPALPAPRGRRPRPATSTRQGHIRPGGLILPAFRDPIRSRCAIGRALCCPMCHRLRTGLPSPRLLLPVSHSTPLMPRQDPAWRTAMDAAPAGYARTSRLRPHQLPANRL